jgi:hypothetical protein
MMKVGIIKSILNILQGKNDDVRNMAMYILSRMMEHGMAGYLCMLLS